MQYSTKLSVLLTILRTSFAALGLVVVSIASAQDGLPVIQPAGSATAGAAPNVVVVLLDDAGFASASTFGGPVPTPTYDDLAAQGIRYNRFHVTAMCSPTRAALLTGRNHHAVRMGGITNLAYGAPGYTSVIPETAATLGRILQRAGYSTGWFGKNHVTPEWEVVPTGPFDRWPTGLGFDYFYGFMGGAADQFSPDLVENTLAVEAPNDPDYILDRDLADRAIAWIEQIQSVNPDKPFFLYLAPGTTHVPLQAPRDWIDRARGRFDAGWDVMRRDTFERQKRMGVIPDDAQFTPRPDSLPAWESLSDKERAVASRLMEVYAAQLAHFDHQFGRIVDAIKVIGEWENTLVVYIDGDNGADAAPGGVRGNIVEGLNGDQASVEHMYDRLEDIGGPRTFSGIPAGWAWALSTPFSYTKTNASHFGGTRAGMVVSWPAKVREPGVVRDQFLHVIDVAPTIYEATGVDLPDVVDGAQQQPFDGVSFAATFASAGAPEIRTTQYFELFGHRAVYDDGWMAATIPPSPQWVRQRPPPARDYEWALYDLDSDYSQAVDLARAHPEQLGKLRVAFDEAAVKYDVYPLDNQPRRRQRGRHLRPYLTNGKDRFELTRSNTRLSNAAFPDIKNREWSISVPVSVSEDSADGVIATQGGYGGGWGLFFFDGRPVFIYRAANLPGDTWRLEAGSRLAAGDHTVTVAVTPEAEPPGSAATVDMTIDDTPVGSIRLPRTVPDTFPLYEGVGIGRDFVTSLTEDYDVPFAFTDKMGAVQIRLDAASETD